MDEFEATWQALYENGSSGKNRDATKRFWDSLTPAQQHTAFVSIPRKAKEGKFIQYDPIRAIKENIRAYQAIEPVNYNGRALPNEPVVIARYNGKWGTYKVCDAELFRMEIATISRPS